MARHRKVSVAIWTDAKFRALSDDAKLLFLYLLTHPHQTSLGAFRTTVAGLAEERGWLTERLTRSLFEGIEKGMVIHRPEACCVWLPNFLKYNGPESPNVVKAWAAAAELIPECDLKEQAIQRAKAILEDFQEGYDEAYRKAFQKAFPKASLKAMPIPEPEPEPDLRPSPPSTAEPVEGVDRPNGHGTGTRADGTNPRALGTNARAHRNRSLAAWRSSIVLIDEVTAADGKLNWVHVREHVAAITWQALERVGGCFAVSKRDRFTESKLEGRFREAFEQLERSFGGEQAAGGKP